MFNPIDLLPVNFVLRLASSYIAGKNPIQVFSLARNLYDQHGFTSTIDLLGEAARSPEQCQSYVEQFVNVIDLIAENTLTEKESNKQFTISFKPSMLCASSSSDILPDQDSLKSGYQRMQYIIERALAHNINMTLEAEQSIWTDYQLETYFSLINAGYTNLGTVLQTRLFRTAQDIKRFDHRMRVRLVIGIYDEDSTIAYTDKKQMKELFVQYGRELFQKQVYVELATHDQYYINKFITDVVNPLYLSSDKFEIQFLYGIPRDKLQKDLVHSGYLVRLYLPFGSDESAGPYCKRRLKSNPNLLLYGLKNILHIQ